MTTHGHLEAVAFDATDIDALAAFWSELTGWPVARTSPEWIVIDTPDGVELAFQRVEQHIAPEWPGQEHPQQMHLDLQVEGHRAAADRAISLGAKQLAEGATWITLADPAGHPFDLCQADGLGSATKLFATTIDAPDAGALARFYAELLGMEVSYDGPEGSLISGGGASVMFQQVADFSAPRWPDPAHPQQAHLDIVVDDLDAGEAGAIALGATRLEGGEKSFRVFADPAGHPFCLTTG
jgi:catechol 2,3-dioxygenase-like lactoylglutathione lyase family enzyme